MDTIKARKQGNAVMISLAKKFDVSEGQVFYISKEDDGSILLVPKVEDYFAGVSEGEFKDEEDELAKDFAPFGREFHE